MKDQATNTRDKPAQIFSHGVSQCDDDVRSLIPSADICKRTLRNQQPTPPIPRLLKDLGELPTEFSQTVGPNPEEFLLYDNGQNANNRLLVFGTSDGLRLLACADTLYMDGNFAMAPNIFKQIYVIRVPFGDTAVTSVYALLPNKTRATYEELLQAIVDKCADLNYSIPVKTVVTDFEDGVLRAVLAVFGRDVESKGCIYHLTQSTWRKIQELGLGTHYNTNAEFRLFCGMIDALAFLPLDNVDEGMRYLKTVIPQDPPEAEELLMYFDCTYVSGSFRPIQQPVAMSSDALMPLRMRRIPPMFAPHLWNVHDATMNNNARTNNICEGWNNKFFNLVGHYHPSVWRVIEWFQREEATVSTIIQQDGVGNPPRRRVRRRYVPMLLHQSILIPYSSPVPILLHQSPPPSRSPYSFTPSPQALSNNPRAPTANTPRHQ
ncbi:putative MULE transposase domain-containing protein 4 [Homarus americanus]|uniref:Putative MULE transposase domain-containing protein 4 n=1 Tax=Homarus americanus TaxID=6706 RepID=A0A8J5K317_HOMAM|nr:putative MULE transposase domain-containing protein 4 [Homarus americanus]